MRDRATSISNGLSVADPGFRIGVGGGGASTPKAVTFRKKKKRFETKESGPLGGACAGHANGYCRVLNVIFTSHKGSFTLVRPSL